MEDYVYVLDYLQKGRGDLPPYKRQPTVYGLGETQFTLLELVPRNNQSFNIGDRIYVGKNSDKREKITKIKGRINYEDLTSTAHGEMPYVLLDVVKDNEARFVKFFNEAPAISTRFGLLVQIWSTQVLLSHESGWLLWLEKSINMQRKTPQSALLMYWSQCLEDLS